jgi:hypothetical protein
LKPSGFWPVRSSALALSATDIAQSQNRPATDAELIRYNINKFTLKNNLIY